MIEVKPTGDVERGVCEVLTDKCVSHREDTYSITFVEVSPKKYVQVCGICLDEQIRKGEWYVKGARAKPEVSVTPEYKLLIQTLKEQRDKVPKDLQGKYSDDFASWSSIFIDTFEDFLCKEVNSEDELKSIMTSINVVSKLYLVFLNEKNHPDNFFTWLRERDKE